MGSECHLVSIIVPVYNRETLLGEAIQSILQQSYPRMEIIVVDDGSTDRTKAVVQGFGKKVHYVYQSNAGVAAARNFGLKLAHGELIGFLDSDDLWTEDKLEIQLSFLAKNPSVEIVLGYTHGFRETENQSGKTQFEIEQKPKRLFHVGSALFRKSVFDKVGVFDEALRQMEDEDWFMRAREHNVRMVCLTNIVQYRRFHKNNLTRDKAANSPFLLRFLKNHRDRRITKDRSPDGIE